MLAPVSKKVSLKDLCEDFCIIRLTVTVKNKRAGFLEYMGAIGFKNSAEQLRKRGKATSSDFMRTNSDGAFRIGIGKPLSGTSNNPKTLNNGLGSSVAKENAGNSINVPQKKRTLL